MSEISSVVSMGDTELARMKAGRNKRTESREMMICFRLKLTP